MKYFKQSHNSFLDGLCKRPTLVLVSSIILLSIGIWFSSGTMAPYATTLYDAKVIEPCEYLVNVDHHHYTMSYNFLNLSPRHTWQNSIYLKRILLPIISFPFMKVFGHLKGGLITNILLYIFLLITFFKFTRKRFGLLAAEYGTILLATYPGITYWAGLPYNQAIIVPCSVWSMMALYRIEDAKDIKAILKNSLLIGLLTLGYDLLPFFGAAAIFMLLWKREFKHLLVAIIVMVIPSIIWKIILEGVIGYNPQSDENFANIYSNIIGSYLSIPDFTAWAKLLLRLPKTTIYVFFFSNMIMIPGLFIFSIFVNRKNHLKLYKTELCVMFSCLCIFLFNNLAPPYEGWQMRGTWIARIYQPLIGVMIFFIARKMQHIFENRGRVVKMSNRVFWLAIILNLSVMFGMVLRNPFAAYTYMGFYLHRDGDYRWVGKNLTKYGRRPLGFCKK